MKINELVSNFSIYTTNEEQNLLDKLKNPCNINMFTEREQIVIDNLVRKSLVSKVKLSYGIMVRINENS